MQASPLPTNRDIGRAIRRIRFWLTELQGQVISQGELSRLVADRTGTKPFAQSAVSSWEKGEDSAPAIFLIGARLVLSDVLGRSVSIDDLLSDEFKKPWVSYVRAAA